MNKIGLIIRREYLTRVRKKSFIIMTILGPLLMAGLFIVPVFIAMNADEEQDILVIDDSGLFGDALESDEILTFHHANNMEMDSGVANVQTGDFSSLLYIPARILSDPSGVKLMYETQPGISTINFIENSIEDEIERINLKNSGIDIEQIEKARDDAKIDLVTSKLGDLGSETTDNAEMNMAMGMMAAVMIYMFIFLYGVQVMRGVIEEKTNRIIEVIISSVKPFQLMMGKIIGIALVSLTQFLLWVGLTMLLTTAASSYMENMMGAESNSQVEQMLADNPAMMADGEELEMNQEKVDELMSNFNLIDFPFLIGTFLFYFLGGYLLYSALFAAVGSAVDNEADSQQFMLPITAPIIFSFVMAQAVIQNPDSSMSFWLSIIPFTSPIIMMVRVPFGVPMEELALSMAMLVVGFIATTWMAAKVYRIGILMYGKKPSFKEIWKWMRQG
ncbi:MAG: ABC-2 type transport system permease protein [Bacteroidia bacterium]|jgi:ABC-2 type transport system permease protein